LFPNSLRDPNGFQYISVVLSVPWRSTSLLGLTGKDVVDSYSLYIGALPARPGKILATQTVATVTEVTKMFRSPDMRQCSTKDCGNNDDLNHPYAIHPDSGCAVVRNTSTFNTGSNEGDWSHTFSGDAGDVVTYNVSTIHHSISPFGSNNSGSVIFSISFQEECPVTTTTQNPLDIALNWGDSKDLPWKDGSWVVVIDTFDGHHYELRGTGSAGQFVNVAADIDHVNLSAANPATLNWP
jgi:hypothetical protein